jgi:hypothetical protein
MKAHTSVARCFLSVALLMMASVISSPAKDGKLKIHVTPKQAYIFADGNAIGEATKHGSGILRPPRRSPSPRASPPTSTSR